MQVKLILIQISITCTSARNLKPQGFANVRKLFIFWVVKCNYVIKYLNLNLCRMVLSKYLITYRKEAAETFESAVLISIPWDANSGTANIETNFINRYVINKELTKSIVK